MLNVFVGRCLALFPAGTIVIDSHHRTLSQRAGFEHALNLSSGLIECSYTVGNFEILANLIGCSVAKLCQSYSPILWFAFNLLHAKLPSQRKQSIDLLCKLIDWFLYDSNFGV